MLFGAIGELALGEIQVIKRQQPFTLLRPDRTQAPAVGQEWQYYDHLEYPYLSRPLIQIKRYG